MIEILTPLLRVAGAGLILLAVLHIEIAQRLAWRTDAARMSPVNAAIFHVHGFFICVVLVAMGLPGLLDPTVFVTPSRAAAWGTWSLCAFWAARLWCQWFVYPPQLWRGKPLETALHWWFTLVWVFLAVLYGLCGALQVGWLA